MSAAAADTGVRQVARETGEALLVRVRSRLEPQTIVAPAGESLRLELRRETASVCAERFLLAAFGIDLLLPLSQPVTIELPPLRPGEYPFGCGFGTLRGRLIVR